MTGDDTGRVEEGSVRDRPQHGYRPPEKRVTSVSVWSRVGGVGVPLRGAAGAVEDGLLGP